VIRDRRCIQERAIDRDLIDIALEFRPRAVCSLTPNHNGKVAAEARAVRKVIVVRRLHAIGIEGQRVATGVPHDSDVVPVAVVGDRSSGLVDDGVRRRYVEPAGERRATQVEKGIIVVAACVIGEDVLTALELDPRLYGPG